MVNDVSRDHQRGGVTGQSPPPEQDITCCLEMCRSWPQQPSTSQLARRRPTAPPKEEPLSLPALERPKQK
ncbi:hypothetical protein VTP01DRAFT_10055 [Rhizomucor pusillus]|uniref:uncharacterized protein n=1 Tax=Rhizomucor pusillus TaxID=4840 RepID=UPI0037424049